MIYVIDVSAFSKALVQLGLKKKNRGNVNSGGYSLLIGIKSKGRKIRIILKKVLTTRKYKILFKTKSGFFYRVSNYLSPN